MAFLLLTLAGSVAASSCQVVAGLTVLEIASGTGGQGGAGGSSCVPCANGQACNDSSECQSNFCSKSSDDGTPGICKATKKLGLECTLDEECGTGYCTDGVCCKVNDCGDECLSCTAATGTCKPLMGAMCGAMCGDGVVMSGQCDGAGHCSPPTHTMNCAPGYGCNLATRACNTTCAMYSDCSSTGFCVTPMSICTTCGTHPPAGSCAPTSTTCETCDANENACVKTCDAVGECTSDKMLDAGPRAMTLVCNDQCNGITVTCQGPNQCEVVCSGGGCSNLVLICATDGPCKLTCTGTGCVGAKVQCGENACEATCPPGTNSPVNQTCGESCGCKKTACT